MATTEEAPAITPPSGVLGRLRPVALAARLDVHYAWVVLGITLLIVTVAAGVRSAPGVLIRPLEREFGWSRSEVSLAIAVTLVCYGLASPLSGRIADRFGIRAMALTFMITSGAGIALSMTIGQLWQLHVYWGIIVGLGTGGVATVMGAIVANTWFESRRGMVTGMVGGAASAGQLIYLPLLVWITNTWDWRTAVGFLSVMMLAITLPLTFLFMRSRPRDVGLEPYGVGKAGVVVSNDTRYTTLGQAMRTGDFWLLCGSFFVCGFTTVGLIGAHFIPHATEHGFSDGQAAGIMSVIGATTIVGTILSGLLCDRYPPRLLLAGYYLFRALSLLILPFITTLPVMGLFALAFGLDYIATVPPTVMLTAERFGRRSVGTIYGWITFVHMIGAAIASFVAGYVHDAAGEYTVAMYLAAALGLVAAMLALGINASDKAKAPPEVVVPAT